MVEENKIRKIESNTLSKFKTKHYFENYGEILVEDDFLYFNKWAKENNKNIYILGNGSNTLFIKKNINSLVLKNKIPNYITCLSEEENTYEVSSNVLMSQILPFCFKKSLDSFYYLASVPASIGGALAMNAGEGRDANRSIYDFVESVKFVNTENEITEIKRSDMNIEFRKTMFTGIKNMFIVSAVFKFPPKDFDGENPIKDRIKWSKQNQDNSNPNCGSVFNIGYGRLLKLVKGLRVGKAYYSPKTQNWIINNSESHMPIITLIAIVKFLHLLLFKKTRIEVIRVK